MAGLLDLFGGGGTTGGGMDLNQLVRPPDPLGDALAAMSERFAKAGEASRLPTSTLGAIGSALGGATTAARASQAQYLDQVIKLQALKRSLRQAGLDDKLIERLAPILFKGGGAGPAPAITPMPTPAAPGAPPTATPAAIPGAPALPQVGDYSGVLDPGASGAPRMPLTIPDYSGALGSPGALPSGGGLLSPDTVIPTQGGAGAAAMPASFRPASLVEPGGARDGGPDALDLAGLLAPDRAAAADPLAGLLAENAVIQPGGPDTLVKSGDRSQLPVELASVRAPRSKEDIVRSESGGNPNVGYGGVDLSNKPRDQYGFPIWEGRMGPAGISHASGKYQFQPGTWREGAAALGINDFSEASQDKVYEWTRAKYGDAPWRASEGRPGVQLAQYAPGGGQGGAPALVGPGSGTIPGLDMTPQEVAAFNALYGLAGHTGSPLKEFLDIYYKSPEYLRGATEATELGRRAVTEPSDIRIAQAKAMNDIKVNMAKDGVMIGPNGEVVPIPGHGKAMAYNADQLEAVKNKYQTQLAETNAKLETVTVPILQKDGTIADTPMSRYDRDQKQQMQGNRAPQPGDIVGKPTAALPPGYEYRMGPQGTVAAGPIANTPEAEKAADVARAKVQAERQQLIARDVVLQDVNRAETIVNTSTLPVVGLAGSRLTNYYQPAKDLQSLVGTLKARASIDAINQARAAMGTSGLGSITEGEHALLASTIASLEQSQSREQFLQNLARFKEAYVVAVHGPGATNLLPAAPVLTTPGAPGKAGKELKFNRQTGQFE